MTKKDKSDMQSVFHEYLNNNSDALLLLDYKYNIQFENLAFLNFKNQKNANFSNEKSSLTTIFDFISPQYHAVLRAALNDVESINVLSKEVICSLKGLEDEMIVLKIQRYAFNTQSGFQIHLFWNNSEKLNSLKSLNDTLATQEQELLESQQRYQIISENSYDLVTLYDTNFNFRFVSPSIVNIGRVPSEFVGRNFFDVFKQRTNFCYTFKQYIFDPLIQQKVRKIEPIIIQRNTDEGERDFELVAKPIFDENDKLQFILTSEIDVTDKLSAENQLKASEQKYRLISENMSDMVTLCDLDCNITYASVSVEKLLGYDLANFMNLSISDWIEPENLQYFKNEIFDLIKNDKQVVRFSYQIIRKDKKVIWVESLASPVFDENMKLTSIQMSTRDISERKKAELELKAALEKEKQLNELKTQFVSMASHQFRTPISVIRANTELLEMVKTKLEGKAKRVVDKVSNRIQSEVKRLINMIDDVLILGTLDAKKTPYRPDNHDLVALCQKVLQDESFAKADNREAEFIIKGEERLVWIDKTLMFNAISNLVSNAFKYSKDKREPIVEIDFQEKEVFVSVTDFGIGISEAEIPKLFQTFHRAQNVLDIEGTGLGLAIAKSFIELNGGKIKVESTLNEMSKFVIILNTENQIK